MQYKRIYIRYIHTVKSASGAESSLSNEVSGGLEQEPRLSSVVMINYTANG